MRKFISLVLYSSAASLGITKRSGLEATSWIFCAQEQRLMVRRELTCRPAEQCARARVDTLHARTSYIIM